MQNKELVIEIFRRIHDLGGYDASEQFDRGWDAAVASCEDVLTELTGLSYDDLEETRMDNGNTEEKLTLGSLFNGSGNFPLDGLLAGIVYYAQFPDFLL